MPYRFYTADVFTDRVFGGNQLAVFPDARGLDEGLMQQIAREFNLSETVFVLPPDDPAHTRRLRIFTPAAEIPFAGHPTIGTAYLLAACGDIPLSGEQTGIVFEERVGPVPVSIRARNGKPEFAQLTVAKLPEFGPQPPPAAELAAMLSLEPEVLSGLKIPGMVSCGVPFLFVPLRDRDAVRRARLRLDRWEALLSDAWANMVFLFCEDGERPGSDLHARMFAPSMGIPEDPATGAAAAALAGFLASADGRPDTALRWVIEQGFEMGRPSILEAEADKQDGRIVAVRVGGAAVVVCKGVLQISDKILLKRR